MPIVNSHLTEHSCLVQQNVNDLHLNYYHDSPNLPDTNICTGFVSISVFSLLVYQKKRSVTVNLLSIDQSRDKYNKEDKEAANKNTARKESHHSIDLAEKES